MKIGLLIPSTSNDRDEWETHKDTYLYKNTFKTFILTYNLEHKYIFYIGIDKNDRIYDNEYNKKMFIKYANSMKNITFRFIYMDGIEKGHLTKMWNRLFKKAYREGCDYFFQCGDDIEFHTKSWVNSCIDVLQQNDNVGVTGPINNNTKILTQSCVSRKHMEIFGYYFPEEIINWFCDNWYNDVYKKVGYFFPLNNHFCANIGGAPRYNVNNKIITSREHLHETHAQLRLECDKIVNRDYIKIKKKLAKFNQKPSSFCTICTSNCAFELVGLLLSLSIYHKNEEIYIMCDSKTKKSIEQMTPTPKLKIKWFVELDEYDGMNRQMMEQKKLFGVFLKNKMKIIEYALNEKRDTLFLDSDIIITDVINNIDISMEVGLSPQFISKTYLDKTGIYNAGLLWTKSKSVARSWLELIDNNNHCPEQINMHKLKKYNYFEFEENYNLQCWRFLLSNESYEQIAKCISSSPNNKLYYKNKPLKFIHTHFLDKRFHAFNTIIIEHLKHAKKYKLLSIIFRVIHNKWILKIPKQPITGLGNHKNDSYLELTKLMKIHNADVDVNIMDNTIHCWLEPNIITYDRPTLEWCNDEINKSSLLLLGNGDIKKEGKVLTTKYNNLNVKPWIFWPRRPQLVEQMLEKYSILSYDNREIESIFIGNFENSVQEKYRTNKNESWKNVLTEYHCTKGKQHKFSHKEYLMKLRNSKYGLCLRGYGSKCHREVELMAFGTIPIVTHEVTMKSYMDPPIENIHYFRVNNTKEFKEKLEKMNEKKWKIMSRFCYEWYQRNVHSKNCWKNIIEHILYDEI